MALTIQESRRYHISHTWAQPDDGNLVYIGFDDLIPYLFSSKIKLAELAGPATFPVRNWKNPLLNA